MCGEEPDLFSRRLWQKAMLAALRRMASVSRRSSSAWSRLRNNYKIHLELDSKLDVEYYARRVCHRADSGAAQCTIRTITDDCNNDSVVVYIPSFTKVKAAHEAAVPTMSVSRAVFLL